MEVKDKKAKLPMYYQQIDILMKTMSKCSIGGMGLSFFKSFLELFNRVCFELPKERQEYYNQKVKELRNKYMPEGKKYTQLCPSDQSEFTAWANNEILSPLCDLQQELFRDMNEAGIFNFLKQNTDEELI